MVPDPPMKEVSVARRVRLAPLFDGYTWNYLPQAALEGTWGRALADDDTEPKIAVLEAPRLRLSIPAGDPRHPLAQAYLAGLPWPLGPDLCLTRLGGAGLAVPCG